MPGLFDPLDVRGVVLRNRIVYPAIATERSPDGLVTEAHVRHYAERAAGGAGTVVVEHSFVREDGRHSERQLAVDRDECVPGLTRLAAAIHDGGALACLQLAHAGPRRNVRRPTPPLGPSARPAAPGGEVPEALEAGHAAQHLVEAFTAAARRALAAGFEAVEVHGAHGFLLSAFTSPLLNDRDDEFGGDWVRRFGLPLSVVGSLHVDLPAELLVWYRLGGDDRADGGLVPEDAARAGRCLVALGADVLSVSGNLCGSRPPDLDDGREGYFVYAAEVVRTSVSVPLVGVGGVRTPAVADALVREGRVDLVAVGRAILADPEWPLRARAALA